jgi:hypothetical protein
LLPLVVAALWLAVRLAPEVRATTGFVAGVAAIMLVVASIHAFSFGWLIPSVVLGFASFASFAATSRAGRDAP